MPAVLTTDAAARKNIPLARGLLDYFPAALAEVACVSLIANEKHNPGEELHHARGKSMDHADCIARHLIDRGLIDSDDNLRHSAKVAWRALALLQQELEEQEGAALPRGARLPEERPLRDGWHCDCGSNVVYAEYSDDEIRDLIAHNGGPCCDEPWCIRYMVRDNG